MNSRKRTFAEIQDRQYGAHSKELKPEKQHFRFNPKICTVVDVKLDFHRCHNNLESSNHPVVLLILRKPVMQLNQKHSQLRLFYT